MSPRRMSRRRIGHSTQNISALATNTRAWLTRGNFLSLALDTCTKGTICWARKDNASQMNPRWPRQIIYQKKTVLFIFPSPERLMNCAKYEVCDKNATPHYTNLSYMALSTHRGMTDAHLEISWAAARAPFGRAAGGPAPAEIIDVCTPKSLGSSKVGARGGSLAPAFLRLSLCIIKCILLWDAVVRRLEAGQRASGCDAARQQKQPSGSAQKRRTLIEFMDQTTQKSQDMSAKINVNKLRCFQRFRVGFCHFAQRNRYWIISINLEIK